MSLFWILLSQIAKRKNDPTTVASEQRRKKALVEEYNLTRSYLTKNDQNRRNYVLSLKVQLGKYNQEAQQFVRAGQKEKAKLSLVQKRMIEEELKSFSTGKTEYMWTPFVSINWSRPPTPPIPVCVYALLSSILELFN